jgi:hypothetical protein
MRPHKCGDTSPTAAMASLYEVAQKILKIYCYMFVLFFFFIFSPFFTEPWQDSELA